MYYVARRLAEAMPVCLDRGEERRAAQKREQHMLITQAAYVTWLSLTF